jgi:hypothetical protein
VRPFGPGHRLTPGYEVIAHLARSNVLDVYDAWSHELGLRASTTRQPSAWLRSATRTTQTPSFRRCGGGRIRSVARGGCRLCWAARSTPACAPPPGERLSVAQLGAACEQAARLPPAERRFGAIDGRRRVDRRPTAMSGVGDDGEHVAAAHEVAL